MTVHFIGAGPGAPDLITVRGLNLIREARVILYAGSLVPMEVLSEAQWTAQVRGERMTYQCFLRLLITRD